VSDHRVTDGESQVSTRSHFSHSVAVTPFKDDEATRRRYIGVDLQTAQEARKTATWCTLCKRELKSAPLYLGYVTVKRTYQRMEGGRHYTLSSRDQKVPLCAECFRYSDECELERCGACGRRGFFCVAPGRPRHCSQRCKSAYYNAIRNARNEAARQKTCEVCSKEFTAKRADAKTCSNACRMKKSRAS